MRIAVCDDCPTARKETEKLIDRWAADSDIKLELFLYDNGDELLKTAVVSRFDVVFLDIIMPLLNGMDTARELRRLDADVPIVFLTSSPDFALESYEVKATNYLLKPVEPKKLTTVLDECAEKIGKEPDSVVLKTALGWQKLYFKNIEFAEAQNKHVVLHLRDGRLVETGETLRSIEEKFTVADGFFKCHRSYIVYLPNVDRFNGTDIITRSGCGIPIARGCGKAFKEAYFTAMFNE